MWLPATETQSADQTSVSRRHTQAGGIRDERKAGLHPSHYNDALGCVTGTVFAFLSQRVSSQGVMSDSPTSRNNFRENKQAMQQRGSMKLLKCSL